MFEDALGGLHSTILSEEAPINAILTKGSLHVLADALAQFKAVLPMQRPQETLDALDDSVDPGDFQIDVRAEFALIQDTFSRQPVVERIFEAQEEDY